MREAEVDRGSDRTVLVQGNLRRLPEGVHSEEVRRAAIALFEEGLGYKRTARKLGTQGVHGARLGKAVETGTVCREAGVKHLSHHCGNEKKNSGDVCRGGKPAGNQSFDRRVDYDLSQDLPVRSES